MYCISSTLVCQFADSELHSLGRLIEQLFQILLADGGLSKGSVSCGFVGCGDKDEPASLILLLFRFRRFLVLAD
jgi:hypothetical protein